MEKLGAIDANFFYTETTKVLNHVGSVQQFRLPADISVTQFVAGLKRFLSDRIHLVPYLKKAKVAGAKIVVVDPRLNFSKNEIDLHLPVYPGTDLVVALAMINYLNKNKLLNWDFIQQHTKSV